jgi:hypothetical protein
MERNAFLFVVCDPILHYVKTFERWNSWGILIIWAKHTNLHLHPHQSDLELMWQSPTFQPTFSNPNSRKQQPSSNPPFGMSYTTNAHSKKSWKYSFTSTHYKEYTNNYRKNEKSVGDHVSGQSWWNIKSTRFK